MARLRLSIFGTEDAPPLESVSIYAKENRRLYLRDDFAVEREIITSGSEFVTYNDPEYRLITEEEASQKKLILKQTPLAPQKTMADIRGGTQLWFEYDFQINGNEFSWGNGTLAEVIQAGDMLRIFYI